MRVLFTTTLAHTPLAFGGSQQSTDDLAAALQARGHEPIITSTLGGGYRSLGVGFRLRRRVIPGPTRDLWRGIPVYRLNRSVGELPEVVERERPDVAIVQAGRQDSLVRALQELRVPTVLYLRDTSFPAERIPAIAPSTVVVANSAYTAEVHRVRGGTVDHVVPPLVDPASYRVESAGTHVLVINPIPAKGAVVALALARANPDIPFLFQEGWHRDEMIWREASRLPNITWRPNTEDMRPVYACARIVLVASGSLYGDCQEAWGRVATEAHVSGIPVLATDWAGLPESVGPGGVLVSREASVHVWNDALTSVWHEPGRHAALSEAALAYAARPAIQPDALAEAVEAALREAIDRSRA